MSIREKTGRDPRRERGRREPSPMKSMDKTQATRKRNQKRDPKNLRTDSPSALDKTQTATRSIGKRPSTELSPAREPTPRKGKGARSPVVRKETTKANVQLVQEGSAGLRRPGKDGLDRKKEETLKKFAEKLWEKCSGEEGLTNLVIEFHEVKEATPCNLTTHNMKKPTNQRRNRYNDIPCYDQTRVILKGLAYDFIHANYVSGYEDKRGFIVTQGPLKNTLSDFWHMVWQEKVCVIIMLCQVREDGKDKCHPYWGLEEGETKTVGLYTITTDKVHKEKIESDTFLRSSMEIRRREESRSLEHLFNYSWPDKGVPSNGLGLIKILNKAHTANATLKARNKFTGPCPILVHCSAGIGRSGTLVAINNCWKTLIEEQGVDVRSIAIRLRHERASSIQTAEQYIFVYQAILEFLRAQKKVQFDLEAYKELIAKACGR